MLNYYLLCFSEQIRQGDRNYITNSLIHGPHHLYQLELRPLRDENLRAVLTRILQVMDVDVIVNVERWQMGHTLRFGKPGHVLLPTHLFPGPRRC